MDLDLVPLIQSELLLLVGLNCLHVVYLSLVPLIQSETVGWWSMAEAVVSQRKRE